MDIKESPYSLTNKRHGKRRNLKASVFGPYFLALISLVCHTMLPCDAAMRCDAMRCEGGVTITMKKDSKNNGRKREKGQRMDGGGVYDKKRLYCRSYMGTAPLRDIYS